jgi:hypothetical protein
MKTTRFTDEQIIAFLKQAEAGMSIKAQVDHVVDTAAKEIISGGAGKHGQNSQKIA